MSGRKFAIIDPAAGISGDMLLGALVDVGAEESWITGLPARLGLPDVTVEVSRADRPGILATKVTLRSPDGSARRTGRPAHTIARELHEQAGRHARASAGGTDGRTTAPKETE